MPLSKDSPRRIMEGRQSVTIRSLLRRKPLVPDMRSQNNMPGKHERRKMLSRQRSA